MGSKYECHPHAAGHSRRHEEEVARSPLRSLRWPPSGNSRWTMPAKGFSKRSASAATHGHAGLLRERAPDCAPRGSRSTSGNRRVETVGQGAAGAARISQDIAPDHARSTRMSKILSLEPKKKVVLAHPRVDRKVGVGGLAPVSVQARDELGELRTIFMAAMLYVVSRSSPGRPIWRQGSCSPTTGAGVPPVSTSQPRCQWEAGTQGEGRPLERAAGWPLSRSITRGGGATRRAHLRALPAAKRRKPPLILLHRAKNDQVSTWISPPGTPTVGQRKASELFKQIHVH